MATIQKICASTIILLTIVHCKAKNNTEEPWSKCQHNGGTWRTNECLISLTTAESCQERQDGSYWKENRCISKEEQVCLEKGDTWDRFQCIPQHVSDCQAKGDNWITDGQTCREKNFEDTCRTDIDDTFFKHLRMTFGTEDCKEIYQRFQTAEHLDFSHQTLSNLNWLKQAYELTRLTLNRTQISTGQIIYAPKIEVLSLHASGLKDLTLLGDLKFLSHLDIRGNQLRRIPDLTHFQNLKTLILTENIIENIDSKHLPSSLQSLHLNHNQLQELQLSELSQLKTLEATGNQIETLNLSQLSSLHTIIIGGQKRANDITDLSWISEIGTTQLDTLIFSDHAIKSLEPLTQHTHLRILDLERNQIEDISALKNLKNLYDLKLSGNPIEFTTRRTPQTCPQETGIRALDEYCR